MLTSIIICMVLKVELRVRYLNQGLSFFDMLPILFLSVHMYLQGSIAQKPFLIRSVIIILRLWL